MIVLCIIPVTGCGIKTILTENGVWTSDSMTIDTTAMYDYTIITDVPSYDRCYCTFTLDGVKYDCIVSGAPNDTEAAFYDKALFYRWRQLNERLGELSEEEAEERKEVIKKSGVFLVNLVFRGDKLIVTVKYDHLFARGETDIDHSGMEFVLDKVKE